MEKRGLLLGLPSGMSKSFTTDTRNKNIIMKESKHEERRRASQKEDIYPKPKKKKKKKKAQERLAFGWEGEARDSTCSTHSPLPHTVAIPSVLSPLYILY